MDNLEKENEAATFKFHCPHCGQKLEAETAWSGMESGCENCKKIIVIPQDTAASAASFCPECRAQLPEKALVCVKCGYDPGSGKTALSEEEKPDGLLRLKTLDSQTQNNDAQEMGKKNPPSRKFCPDCYAHLPEGALVCVKCGYDTRSGKTVVSKENKPIGLLRLKKTLDGQSQNTDLKEMGNENPPESDFCWFCSRYISDNEHSIDKPLFREIHRESEWWSNSYKVIYYSKMLSVPRCSRCARCHQLDKDLHRPGSRGLLFFLESLGLVIFFGVLIGWYMVRKDSEGIGTMALASICLFVFELVILFACFDTHQCITKKALAAETMPKMLKENYDGNPPRPESDAKQYPPLIEHYANGFKDGDKPTS